MPSQPKRAVWVLEDNAHCSVRDVIAGVTPLSKPEIVITLHRISRGKPRTAAKHKYRPGSIRKKSQTGGRAQLALALIKKAKPKSGVVVSGASYGSMNHFTDGVARLGIDFLVQLRPSTKVALQPTQLAFEPSAGPISELAKNAPWKTAVTKYPNRATQAKHSVADLGCGIIGKGTRARLLAIARGGIKAGHRAIDYYATSLVSVPIRQLLTPTAWVRWIRQTTRKNGHALAEDSLQPKINATRNGYDRHAKLVDLPVRANITISRLQSEGQARTLGSHVEAIPFRGALTRERSTLTVIELFAGAGGMGLGFLLANRGHSGYRIAFSGEVSPACIETLKINHEYATDKILKDATRVPQEVTSVDLRRTAAADLVRKAAADAGGVDVLIGGPPCQGFSSSNRNSWSSSNPHNALVKTFLRYVRALQPKVLLMENVQGMLWTTPADPGQKRHYSVADYVARRLASAGYNIFPTILDAARYGVPQHRSRLFILGIHRDLGYAPEDFGAHGPFPHPTHGPGTANPYATVRDAIADLPVIGNGSLAAQIPYALPRRINPFLCLMRAHAPRSVIFDHVTSCHAEYVIERYRRIPPGGNWQDILEMMTNYTAIDRTHSNIYRRLKWDETSITIGDYRKSMIVHPAQHRGLSVREAARLQSFPDWYRFSGGANGSNHGIMHKQKQLANAVCPLVTQAFAEFILKL